MSEGCVLCKVCTEAEERLINETVPCEVWTEVKKKTQHHTHDKTYHNMMAALLQMKLTNGIGIRIQQQRVE
jgi:hypothetical protein